MKNWLIKRAMKTPYFHLDGYMERYWLVPYRAAIQRAMPLGITFGATYDGTGPVSPWRRPIAWLLQRFDIAVRVHHILRSDKGRDPHDHPWPYLTIILRGGYHETRYNDEGVPVAAKWYGPGSVIFRPAKSWHMLDLPPYDTCWTLFITGRKKQKWGFNVDGVKVPYDEYLKAEQQ